MKTKANFRAIKLGFALAVIAGCLPQTTLAGRQIIPATGCQVWGGDSNHADYITYSQFGKVINTHENLRISVVCPIPRLNQSNSANWVRVYYEDYNPLSYGRGDLMCRLQSNYANGNGAFDWLINATDGTDVDIGFFTFTNVTAAGGPANFPRNYTMFCTLPPAYWLYNEKKFVFSSIGSIVIDERNSETH